MLFALGDDKQLERSAVQQLRVAASALPLVFAAPESKVVRPLETERSVWSLATVVRLDDEKNVARGEARSGVKLCTAKDRFSMYED